ncbi:MAG TPA: IPT/TIG domain-containing protein [Solirubrobacterales bacterium]|nr:IPT/TIG domain-containing protein [Solirubrobacterales bacterium]
MTDAGFLIAPLEVEALVVNDEFRLNQAPFIRAQMEYETLGQGQNAQPGLDDRDTRFETEEPHKGISAADFYNGVYLKWRLPRALTHGEQDAVRSELRFPPIPNRWIVVRYDEAGGTPAAWVVESDYEGAQASPPQSIADVNTLYLTETEGAPTATWIGRRVDLAEDTWSESPHSRGLTAAGAGNPAFAFYQPQNNNVLSFVDTLAAEGLAKCELSYQVFGWYSNPAEDPLAAVPKEGLLEVLEALGWTLPEGTDSSLTASRTLLSGYLSRVEWQTEKTPPGGVQRSAPLSLAVGSSSVEALTGLVSAQAAAASAAIEPELLEAFQLDMLDVLDEPDGEAKLAEQLRESLFQRFGGGFVWEIADVPGTDAPGAAELEKEAEWLLELNQAQARLDAQIAELADLRLHLYELWWKAFSWRPRYSGPITKQELEAQLDPETTGTVADETKLKYGEVEASAKGVPSGLTPEALEAAIKTCEKLHGLPSSRRLKRTEAAPFYTPNNPVLLIAGAGASGIRPAPERALCRFPQQLVSGLKLKSGEVTAATMGTALPRPDLSPATGVPWDADLATALVVEAFFTDPSRVGAIATATGATPAEVETAMEEAPTGTRPTDGLGVWMENPWRPLLLIWEASYYPIPYASDESSWAFEADRYVWTGSGGSDTTSIQLGGTIQLGTAAVFNMAARLKAFLASNPHLGNEEREQLETLLAFVSTQENDWDLLSQALDGFNAGLQMSQPGVFTSPSGTAARFNAELPELIGPVPGYPPAVGPPPTGTPPPSLFQPLRGGQFCFTEIALVDEWGQARRPIEPKSSQYAPVFLPATMRSGASSSSLRFDVLQRDEPPPAVPRAIRAPGAGDGATVTVTKLTPDSVEGGGGDLVLEVEGSGFASGQEPTVTWNGLPLATEFISETKLKATVPAGLLALPDAVAVAVRVDRHLRAEAEETFVEVPPALPQPARLAFDQLAASDDNVVVGPLAPEADPVCGWVLPNHLDSSLMAYLPTGEPLGELSYGVGAAGRAAIWTAAPGALYSELSEVEAHVPHLGKMLGALAAQGEEAFAAFLAAVDESLWMSAPASRAFDGGLGTLIGCPLALVRARVQFELLGAPRRDPSWQYTFQQPTPNPLAASALAVELGGRAWLDDGLVGYFEGDEYEKLYVVAQARAAASKYLQTIGEPGNHLALAADGSAPALLSLLLDPRAPVHAATPALPGVSLSLPARRVEAALGALEVTFRVNGGLTGSETPAPGGTPGPPVIQLPLPATNAGEWSWQEQDAGGWASYETAAPSSGAPLGDVPPVLRRGLLTLSRFAKPDKPSAREKP